MSFSMKELLAESQPSQAQPSQPQASQPQATPAQPQPQASSPSPTGASSDSFSMAELMKDEQQGQATQATTGGPNAEEQAFLAANPGHAWVPADPKFPNRPAGIYPTGKGNEWRNDPSYTQAPIDLHFVKHTLEGAATGAAAVAPAVGLAAIPEALPPVLIHTVQGVRALGAWAEAHPMKAYMLFQVAKELVPGAKKAMGFIKAAPTEE